MKTLNICNKTILDFETRNDFINHVCSLFKSETCLREDLFRILNIKRSLDKNALINEIGVADKYNVEFLAFKLWWRSNYNDIDLNVNCLGAKWLKQIKSGCCYLDVNFKFELASHYLDIPQRSLYRRIKTLDFFAIKLSGWFIVVNLG